MAGNRMRSVFDAFEAAEQEAMAEEAMEKQKEARKKGAGFQQWARTANGSFSPVGGTVNTIEPGHYDIAVDQGQVFFVPVRARTDELIRFPDSASLKVLEGIQEFWERADTFAKYGLPHKRGIMLYGPPGAGKSCTLQLVARDVIERGGVVLTFGQPSVFLAGYRALRDIQPDTPIVVLMEDFDSLPTKSDESVLLNLLDGAEELSKVVFLATTNYPERMPERIMNRPSRFDLRIHVPHPSAGAREVYLRSLLQGGEDIDVERYVKDTEGMSIAHVKELFVATVVLGGDYDETVARLKEMHAGRTSLGVPESASGGYL